MKEGIHPDYHTITYVMTDGSKHEVKSTYRKEGEELVLQVDPLTHPAYTGKRRSLDVDGRMDRFNKKYGRK